MIERLVSRRFVLLFLFFILNIFILFGSVLSSKADVSDFDDDEDDEIPEIIPIQIPSQASGSSFLPPIDWKRITLAEFYIEFSVLAFLIFYISWWWVGRKTNATLATLWGAATLPVWKRNFEHVGIKQKGGLLIRDGPSDFIFFASGRENVKFVYGYLTLKERHNLLLSLLDLIGYASFRKDKIIFECRFPDENLDGNSNKSIDSQVFALASKNVSGKLLNGRYDLSQFTKSREKSLAAFGFPKEHFALFSDNLEMPTKLAEDKRFISLLKKLAGVNEKGESNFRYPLLESIVFSDQPTVKPETLEDANRPLPKSLIVTFLFPEDIMDVSEESRQLLLDMVDLTMDIIDAFGGPFGKLSNETRKKIEQTREDALYQLKKVAEQERLEELQKKKFQEKKAKLESISKLSPEQQRKFEEKERKKELKKQQNKRMKKGKAFVSM